MCEESDIIALYMVMSIMGALKFKIVVFVDLGSFSNYKAATYIV